MKLVWNKICEDCGREYKGLKDTTCCANCMRKRRGEVGERNPMVAKGKRIEPTEQISKRENVKLGDWVSLRPQTFSDGHMYGKVVWIHPDKRYAVVEFTVEPKKPRWGKARPAVKLRECFHLTREDNQQK